MSEASPKTVPLDVGVFKIIIPIAVSVVTAIATITYYFYDYKSRFENLEKGVSAIRDELGPIRTKLEERQVTVSEPYFFGLDGTYNQTAKPIPNLWDWKFCTLTRVTAGTSSWCKVLRDGNVWKIETGAAGQQQCEVTCWK